MKSFFYLMIILISCSSTNSNSVSSDLLLITNKSDRYFIGIGTGSGSTENIAIKIARASALGELSKGINVHINSKLELYETERSNGTFSESFSESIIEIGQATIQKPEFEIISSFFNRRTKQYSSKVLAKKLKRDYYSESAKYINLYESDKLLEFLSND